MALDLVTSVHPRAAGERAEVALQRALFDAACAVNTLRNKQGTGHGRPFLPTLSDEDARLAAETVGIVSQMLLDRLKLRSAG